MKDINEKTFDLLEATKLNWSVNKTELVSIEGQKTESFGMFRNDSGAWLGTVGSKYEPMQNSELALVLLTAAEGLNLDISRGGLLFGGQKVYFQSELAPEYVGKSDVKRWLSILSSHDGSASLGFGSSNTVVVCQNTFNKAFGELQKFRHTASMKERVNIAQTDLRQSILLDDKLMATFKTMAKKPLQNEYVANIMKVLFEVEPGTKQSDISTRKTNQLTAFAQSVEQSVSEQGANVWALFNGVTRYTNHVSAPSEPDKKQDYLMSNGGYAFNLKGFNELLKLVEN